MPVSVAITLTNPQSEIQWDFVLSHFVPDNIILLGDAHKPTSKVMRGATRVMPDAGARVLMAPLSGRYIQGETPLREFEHPEDAIYIFGADNAFTSGVDRDHSVYIETDTKHDMFSWVAGAITLYDRRCRRG